MNYAPEITGIGKYTGELSFYLANRQYEVQVITGLPYYPEWKVAPGYKKRQFTSENIAGVNIMRAPVYVPGHISGSARMLQELSFFLSSFLASVYVMLFKRKFHFVIVVAPSMLSGFIGMWYRLWNRSTQLIYHVQDLQIDAAEELRMLRQPLLLRVLKHMERLILRNANLVSTISTGMKQRLFSKCSSIKNLIVFPNWVDDSKVFPTEQNTAMLKQLGLPVDRKLIFYSGAMGEKQGLAIILDVAKWALTENPELYFVLCGTGPYASHLRVMAGERGLKNIQFIELQPEKQFNMLLNSVWLHLVIQRANAADLVMPSKLTNILAVGGLVLVTATENTSLYDIVNGHKTGYIVPPDDAAAVIDGIRYLCNNEAQAAILKQNALCYAKRYLSKDEVISKFIDELENLKSNTI